MKRKPKTKKRMWFKKVRGSYLPASWQGMLLYCGYFLYVTALFIGWYLDGHVAWKLLVVIIPTSALAAALMQYAASKTSK